MALFQRPFIFFNIINQPQPLSLQKSGWVGGEKEDVEEEENVEEEKEQNNQIDIILLFLGQ